MLCVELLLKPLVTQNPFERRFSRFVRAHFFSVAPDFFVGAQHQLKLRRSFDRRPKLAAVCNQGQFHCGFFHTLFLEQQSL